mgnify:CR=1 FL=1
MCSTSDEFVEDVQRKSSNMLWRAKQNEEKRVLLNALRVPIRINSGTAIQMR